MPELDWGDLATPWAVHVVATLRIGDLIARGTQRVDELAHAAGCDAHALERVLRHLVQHGMFEEPRPGEFALNDAAKMLLEPGARIGFDLDGIGGRMAHAWSSLLSAVRSGEPAYTEIFGRPFWADLDANPAVADSFDELMGPAGHGTPDPAILIDGDWQHVRHVVDVGGGTGALLAQILRQQPHVRGTLVDLPRTIAHNVLAEFGDRVTLSEQSFFDPLPPGADVYVLKNVLADWPDEGARALLARCAEAAAPAGRVVILGGITEHAEQRANPELLMLVLVGGKSRTLPEFSSLARSAGLEVYATGHQPSGRYLVECRPSTTAGSSAANMTAAVSAKATG